MSNENLSRREQEEIEEVLRTRVIVRVWTSRVNPVKPGKGMGHISLQTPKSYISLWPTEPATAADRGKIFPHDFSPDADDDYWNEGERQPEYVFCLYTLESKDIDLAFEVAKDTIGGWTMAPYGIKTEGAESCSSLAWKMLKAGNILELVSNTTRSMIGSTESSRGSALSSAGAAASVGHTFASKRDELAADFKKMKRGYLYAREMAFGTLVESPDSIAASLIVAKQRELEKYPLTKHIEYPDETNVTVHHSHCCIL